MPQTVYAAFADAAHAESAAGALLDHGVSAKDISLVVNEEAKKRVQGYQDEVAMGSRPTIVSRQADETAEVSADLNPAQNDYPRSGSESPTELSSRPPNSKYDWNPDLDKKSYNADYERTNTEKMDDEIRMEGDRDRARVDPASVAKENDEGTVTDRGLAATSNLPHDGAGFDADQAAKAGVTTTTVQGAAKGAAKGVGFGLGVGALAAVASLAIPGFGLVLGGGALAVAVAGLAATSGAGAVAGGIVGYLKDQGVPADGIPQYQKAYENGGAILSVVLGEGADTAKIQDLLGRYGASNVKAIANAA